MLGTLSMHLGFTFLHVFSAEAEDNMTAASQDDDSEKDNDNNEDDDQIDPAWQARLRKRLPASKQTVNDCSAAEKSRKRSSKMAPVGPIPGNDDAIVEEKPSLEKRGEMAAAAQLAGMKMETDTTTGVTIVVGNISGVFLHMESFDLCTVNGSVVGIWQWKSYSVIKRLHQIN